VFTFTLDGTSGEWTFDLEDQLDHPALNDALGDDTENELTIYLGSLIQATDEDGDTVGAQSSASVQIVVDDDTPQIVGEAPPLQVDEDELADGNADTGAPGEADFGGATTDSFYLTTFLSVGADEPGTYQFTADAIATLNGLGLTSDQAEITFELSGDTITGSTASGEVLTLTLTAAGQLSVELKDQIDHTDIPNDMETNLGINLGAIVEVVDADGDALSVPAGDIVLNIGDDVPKAVADVAQAQEQGAVNLVLIIDVSGSMGQDPGVPGFDTRLELAQAALADMLNSTNVNQVLIVTFSSGAESLGWFDDPADAIAAINALTAGGNTNYDAALIDTIDAYEADPPSAADATIALFLSDGEPTVGSDWPQIDGTQSQPGIQPNEQTVWETFLTDNDITSYAVGVGSGVDDSDLEPIADNPIVLADEGELSDILSSLVTGTTGTVLTDGVIDDSFGADGGRILSIEVDDTLYTWSGSDIDTTGDDPPAGAVIGADSITVATDLGGTFTFEFATGDWEYVPPTEVTGPDEIFTYTLVDGDGDQQSATLTIDLVPVNDAPVINLNTITVRDDFETAAYTNNDGTADWAGAWDEESDGTDSATAGDIRIVTDLGDGALRLGDNSNSEDGNALIERVADLTGATSAILSFDFRAQGIDDNEEVRVFISSDGVNFDEVLLIDENSPTGYMAISFDISAYISATTTVRIEVEDDLDNNEFAFIDNLQIAVVPTFTEGGAAVKIMPTATVEDADLPANFSTGSITVTLTEGVVAGDQLVLSGAATPAGPDVKVAGVTVGTVTAGNFGTTSVTITLNPNATDGAVEAILQSLTFQSTSENPTAADRIATVTFNDGSNTGLGGPKSDTVVVTIEVFPVNDAPVGTNKTIGLTEDVSYVFTASDFGFSDTDANTFSGVVINTLPAAAAGVLRLGNTAIAAGAFITAAQIADGSLIFAPTDNSIADSSFTFSVQDDGGTANGGFNTDPTPNTMTLDFGADQADDTNAGGTTNNNTLLSLTSATSSILEAGGATDALRIDTAAAGATTFGAVNFFHSDNNLEVSWTSGVSSPVITVLNHFNGTNDFESFGFDDGGTFAGYSFIDEAGTAASYVLDQDVAGGGTNDILAGTAAAESISGAGGSDLLFGNGGDDTLSGGIGADLMVGGLGNDIFVVSSGASPGTITAGVISGYDVIADFNPAFDKLTLESDPAVAGNTTGTNGTNSTLLFDGATVKSHAISNGIITFDDDNTYSTALSIDSNADLAAVVEYLRGNSLGNDVSVAFTATIGGTAHTFVYEQVGNSPSATNDLLVDLAGVTLTAGGTSLSTLFSAGAVDPLILDLGAPGLDFSGIDDGVAFDINADGLPDQMAWTAGEDGILALDIDGNGSIDSGNEIVSPWLDGGGHAGSLAALASLDQNGDGRIDSSDEAFTSLRVWQDLDHDGVSDAGELSSLTALGIASVDLGAAAVGGEIDGQSILTEGSFTLADGTSGSYVEVELETSLGDPEASEDAATSADDLASGAGLAAVEAALAEGQGAGGDLLGGDGDDQLHGGDGDDQLHGGNGVDLLSGGGGADTYYFAALDSDGDGVPDTNADQIVDYSFMEGDRIDLSELLDGSGADASNLDDYLRLIPTPGDGTSLTLQADTNGTVGGSAWFDVVVLSGYAQTSAGIANVVFQSTEHTVTAPV
jgi:hypothetical protein